ncbi:hypothetical protein [Pararhizobium sp. IMCC21322]|uniref:DUF6958 family protein n=1 Tax=Pararhizobium sp. IMCC21322 TaxID=3067903 RepID=UPI00274178F9|nr:hypothetical protein [Pararhizobium sp. IMCC21322]
MSDAEEMIEVESITQLGKTKRVNRAKYLAMRDAFLPVLPTEPPGMTFADAKAALLPNLSEELFPGGEKAGWWLVAVQLDLEAKGVIERGGKGPVRLFRITDSQ